MRRPLPACLFALALAAPPLFAADDYKLGPDSMEQPGVPKGEITKHSWTESKIYPGTVRDYWVYVPAQYDASKPACVMVFQDGGGYVSTNGSYRVPVVFDITHSTQSPAGLGDKTGGSPQYSALLARAPEWNCLLKRPAATLK